MVIAEGFMMMFGVNFWSCRLNYEENCIPEVGRLKMEKFLHKLSLIRWIFVLIFVNLRLSGRWDFLTRI